MVADLSLPIVERVLPNPMMGDSRATLIDAADNDPRTSLLCGVAIRAATTCSRGDRTTTADTSAVAATMPANRA